ncbi:MAG: hypothetical protein ACOCXH_03890 [Cyclobacteriaceae bacterium]
MIKSNSIYLRVTVDEQARCYFSYSLDGNEYVSFDEAFQATKERWIGAKVGIFVINPNIAESKGYADFDWFRFE